MKHRIRHVWKTLFYHFCLQSQSKAECGGGGLKLCANRWTKEKELGQPFSIKASNLESTQSLLQWEVLCDSSCQTDPRFLCCLSTVLVKERENTLSYFSPSTSQWEKTHHLNTITGKLVQRCHALQLHAALTLLPDCPPPKTGSCPSELVLVCVFIFF